MESKINLIHFGKRMKTRRQALGLKQSMVAERLNISTNHLSTLENGKASPSFELLCKICEVLDVTPDYLMMGCLHTDNVSQNIIDRLRRCPKQPLQMIYDIIDVVIANTESEQ